MTSSAWTPSKATITTGAGPCADAAMSSSGVNDRAHASMTPMATNPRHRGAARDAPAVTVRPVDVRIGVTQAPRELTVEMPDDERDDTVPAIEAALAGAVDVLWLTDKRGQASACPPAKIAYVEVGTARRRPPHRLRRLTPAATPP